MPCELTYNLPRTPEDTRDTAEYTQLLRIYDTLFLIKEAFDCVEAEVAALIPVVATAVQSASNVGGFAESFKAKVGTDLTFRTIKPGSGITIVQDADNIEITAPAPVIPVEITVGVTTVNFGAFPGKAEARVTIAGQAGILGTAKAQAWIRPEVSADHSAEEHSIEDFFVSAESISAGNGFTIVAHPRFGRCYGVYNINWSWAP